MMDYFGAKKPIEEFPVTFDFTDRLGSSDVDTVTVAVTDQGDDSDATDDLTNIALQTVGAKTVSPWVRGGITGHDYKIACRITGTGGETLDWDGVLSIREPVYYFGAKQPAEAYYVRFNFTKRLGASDIAEAVVSAVNQATGAAVTSSLTDVTKQALDGKYAYTWVQDGSTLNNYKITCRITGTGSEVLELDGILPVMEI